MKMGSSDASAGWLVKSPINLIMNNKFNSETNDKEMKFRLCKILFPPRVIHNKERTRRICGILVWDLEGKDLGEWKYSILYSVYIHCPQTYH